MQQLKRSEYTGIVLQSKAVITICGTDGAFIIQINRPAAKQLDVTTGDAVVLYLHNGNYMIGKAQTSNDPDAYKLRAVHKGRHNALQFNCAALVKEIIKAKDLAIGPGRKRSIRAELLAEAVEWNDIKLYEINLD